MLTCSAVHHFEYYDVLVDDVRRLVARAQRILTRERKSLKARRHALGYYDHGVEDGIGIFERLCRGNPDPHNLFAGLESGTEAQTTIIRRIAARRHPLTGKALPIFHRVRWLVDKDRHAKQVVGHDIQMSAPKAVSVLWAFASPSLRALIAGAHHRAVTKVLAFIRDNGLIVTRSGQDGRHREPVDDALIARYFHTLSRANDPHIHTHCVLMNLCQRSDGSIGVVDTGKIVAFASAMTELYRAELASILSRELGLKIKQEEHGFSLPAIPKAVVTLFSKRRIAIEEEAEARGFEPGKDRQAAQNVAWDTRQSKTRGVTADTLLAGWVTEAREKRHDPVGFMAPIEVACLSHSPASTYDVSANIDRNHMVEVAFAQNAKLSWPDLLACVSRQMQTCADADQAIAMAEALRGSLIALPQHDHGEMIYTTATIVMAEHGLLKTAIDGRSQWTKVGDGQIDAALEAFPNLTIEQRSAVRHALNPDRLSVVNGSAGSGKSFMSFSIARVAERHGLKVIGTSAAWTAAHVLRREAGLGTENTFSLAKLMTDIAKGRLTLNEQTVVIVDEAGMAPLTIVADLVKAVDGAGAKMVLVGDVRQLQPVGFGAPMRALAAELGFAEMIAIRRQRHDWMRQASVELAAHRPDQAVDAYDRAGCLSVYPDRDGTLAAAADDYVRQAVADPSECSLGRQLLITSRNRDVVELNRLVRDRLRAGESLGPDLVRVKALPRGKREGSEPVVVPLAIGDRIVFGARLELRSRTIFNSDVARIIGIDAAIEDPRITFLLDRSDDDGKPITIAAHYSELVSRFSEARVPEFQHAYAMTAHGAQGATVERAILVDIEGLSVEASYVGMTRHREHLSIHLSAEKSLSRHRREVFRLSRRSELIDDEGPSRAVAALTKDEREAALTLAKARMRQPQPDPNPSYHVFDRAAWLASDDPVGDFRRQAARRGGRGGIGRLEPDTPQIAALGDPTVLSIAETSRLTAIPIGSEPVLKAFELTAVAPDRLHHDRSGATISIGASSPEWSAEQRRELAVRRALQDHPLVQMAIVLLKRPLRWARAWVRRSFGLRGLNPLAAATHAEDRRVLERQYATDADALLFSQSRPITPNIDDRDARRSRRMARWQAADASMNQKMPLEAPAIDDRLRAARRVERFARWAAAEASVNQKMPLEALAIDDRLRATRRADRFARWAAWDAQKTQRIAVSPSPEQVHDDAAVPTAPVSVRSDLDKADALSENAPPQVQIPTAETTPSLPIPPDVEAYRVVVEPTPPIREPLTTVQPPAEKVAPARAEQIAMHAPISVPFADAQARPKVERPRPAPRVSTREEMVARVAANMVEGELSPTLLPSRPEVASRPVADQSKPKTMGESPGRSVYLKQHSQPQTLRVAAPRAPHPAASVETKPASDQPQIPEKGSPNAPGNPQANRKRLWNLIRKKPDQGRE